MRVHLIFIFIFLIALISASTGTLGTYKKGDCVELMQICDNCTYNNISSVVYPNLTIAESNLVMSTIDNIYYNYSYCNTSVSGIYKVLGYGNLDGLKTPWAYEFEINPSGIIPTDQRTESVSRGIYFTLVIAILFFITFIFSKQKLAIKWTYFGLSILFFLITLNILFVGLQSEVVDSNLESFFDGFTAIFWYIFWFVSGLLILLWAFTFIQTYLYRKNMRNIQRFGGT